MIAGIGTVAGVTTGLLLVALPLLAIGGGWLFTRSRLPVGRRMAS